MENIDATGRKQLKQNVARMAKLLEIKISNYYFSRSLCHLRIWFIYNLVF